MIRASFSVISSFFAVACFFTGTAACPTGAALLPACAAETPPLTSIVRSTLEIYFTSGKKQSSALQKYLSALPVDSRFEKPAGVFVTVSRGGNSRACWGSVFPEYGNVVKSTVFSTIAAVSHDYRYKKISSAECKYLKPQVTVIDAVEPIQSIAGQNPLRDGLMVRSGGKSAVLLPREAIDAHYQLVKCKLKAGIKAGEPCQLYRLKATVYE